MIPMKKLGQRLFTLEPQYRERVWGGRRLKEADPPVGEAWVAFGESRVREGARAGRTLDELAEECGEELLGAGVARRCGGRFPLLVKLLDCADWLSVQVHPNDEQAARMVGPGASGKTEAWHFLSVEPGATIYAGVRAGTTREALASAIREGRVFDVAERFEVRAGETLYIPSGTLHALGPGLLLYEVQQSCDTTYRVYDWGRPATAGRALHVEEAVAVTEARPCAATVPPPALRGTAEARALSCPHFELDVLRVEPSAALEGDTGGRSFHLLTVTEGSAEILSGGERVSLARHETALVAAGTGAYRVVASADSPHASLLRSAVPPDADHLTEKPRRGVM
jgi:mannose-6-phosphate isomerase